MHCSHCNRQRPPGTRFCVLCGSPLVARDEAEIREELSRVEWLLGELPRWDVTLVSRADAKRLALFYEQQVEWMRAELSGVSQTPSVSPMTSPVSEVEAPISAPPPELVEQPSTTETLAPPEQLIASPSELALPVEVAPESEARELPPLSQRRTLPSAHPLEAREPDAPEVVVVQQASAWSRVWKPFLTDSVGWFVGGFLILAGVYWLVADAWDGMTSLTRAATVFGLAAGWTLAFFAWSKFLLRREVTAPAGRMLERLSAAMAPLATVAINPTTGSTQTASLMHDAPLVFWPLVLGWSAVSGWLAFRATKRVDERGALPLGAAFALAAAMMGTAPMLTGLGVHAAWLSVLPVALAAWAFSYGPRQEPSANQFLVAAFAWPVTLFVARLEVALLMAGVPLTLTLLAPVLAAGVASVRWLQKPPERAADAWSVLVVMVQVGLLFASIDLFTPKPAFVVTALIGAVTAYSFARERVSLNSARWLPVAYVFAYLAYQRIDQIVPPAVREAFNQLKASLGYSTAPMPASYGSVYAALFVIGVGVLASVWARSKQAMTQREGSVLLDTTAVASGLSSLLAIASLQTDARPALIATPLLGVATLLFALRSGRLALTIAGTLGAICAAGALWVGLDAPVWVGVVAVALAAVSIPALGAHRVTVSLGAALLGVWGLALGLFVAPSFGATMTVALSSVALLALARNLDLEELLDLAWAGPVLTVVAGSRWLAPSYAPTVLAAFTAMGAGLSLLGGRWKSTRSLMVLGALSAVLWHFLVPTTALWPGVTMLLAALTLFLASRTKEGASLVLETGASTLALATLLPEVVFPWPSPMVPQVLAGVVVAGASVWSLLRGRSFRVSWISAVALVMALACGVDVRPENLIVAAVIALLATPALIPAVTLPVASLLVGYVTVEHLPHHDLPLVFSIHTLVLAAMSLLDRVPAARRWLLNGSKTGWPAVVMSALWLVPALAVSPEVAWLPTAVALVVPVLWSFGLERRGARLFAVALVSATVFWVGGLFLLVAPLVAVAMAFTLRSDSKTRDLVLDRLTVAVIGTAAVFSAMVCVQAEASSLVFIAWSVALLVLPIGALAARLVLAAIVVVLAPSLLVAGASVGVLIAVGFALRHAPELTAKALGARSVEFAQAVASFAAVSLAVAIFVRAPSGETQALIVGSLLSAALLLGFSVLVPIAMLVGSANSYSLGLEKFDDALYPFAPWLATAAAALAVVLRRGFALEAVEEVWDRIGTAGKGLDLSLWAGAALLVGCSLASPSLLWVLPALVLLVTPKPVESVFAVALVALTLMLKLPTVEGSVYLAAFGAGLAWFGALRDSEASQTRLHLGWVMVLASLVFSADLHAWQMPACWALAAVTAWAVVRSLPWLRWVGWAAVWAASHAVLAWAGLALSTGAPKELILPWFALASVLVALRPALTPSIPQHARIGLVLRGIAITELSAGMFLCPGGYGREAIAVVLAAGLSLWLAWREAKEDEPRGVWLGALAATTGFVLTRVLAGGDIGLVESIAALVVAGAASLLASRLPESLPKVTKALTSVAMWWPVLGLVTAPWNSPMSVAVLLVAFAVHYTLLAQQQGQKPLASVLSAVAFNGAVLTMWFGSGWGEAQYVLVPMGLSGLVLVQVFSKELGDAWSARLRAVAVGLVYAAAAFRPLAIDAPWAFFLCVALCVAGVGAGIALRVRSFVTLGSIFLVTTVVATLVRWGVREPRLGALFLSGLGLAVVAFMVVVTTKKAELLERYKRVRGALERWDA